MSRFQLHITCNSLCTGTIDNTPAPQPPSESTPTMSSAQPDLDNTLLTLITNPNNPNNNLTKLTCLRAMLKY